MKKIITGAGITKKEIGVFETSEEQRDHYREVAKTFNDQKNWFERIIFMNGIEAWVLRVTENYIDKTGEDKDGNIVYETIVKEDSELQFALETRSFIRIIRSAIDRNDIDEAVRFSFMLGEKLTEIRFKFNWEKPALMGESHSNSQSERAKHPRSKINLDDKKFSITSIIEILAKKKDEWGDTPAKDLWNDLYAELDKNHLKPKEREEGKEQIISYCKDDDGNLAEIKFNSFNTMISKARNKKLT